MAAVTYAFPTFRVRVGGPARPSQRKINMALIGAAYAVAVVLISAAQLNLDRAFPSFGLDQPVVAVAVHG